jgi:hemolysin III
LLHILSTNTVITHLKVTPAVSHRHCRAQTFSGDIDAHCLRLILSANTTITELDISYLGLGPNGIEEIALLLAENKTLKSLCLSHNPGNRNAYVHMEKALASNSTLRYLDISSNRLGYDTVLRLQKACLTHKRCRINSHGNNVIEENLNTVSHLAGFVLALIAVCVLLFQAMLVSFPAFWSTLLYSLSLLAMLGCSTVFHSHFDSHVDHYEFWNILDHAAIYLLIAGSFLPFVVASPVLRWNRTIQIVAALQWVLAMAGIAFGFYATHHKFPRKLQVEVWLSLIQGFTGLLMYHEMDTVLLALGEEVLHSVALSVACYLVGMIFFIVEHKVHPLAHAIWHMFVNLAAAIHYMAVLHFILDLKHPAGGM